MRPGVNPYRAGTPAFRYGYPGQRGSYSGQRGGINGNRNGNRNRGPYIRSYNWGYPYPYGWSIWPGYPTVIDGYDDYDSSADQGYAPYADYGDQGSPYGDQGYPGPDSGNPQYGYSGLPPAQPWPSIGPYAQSYSAPQSSVAPEPAVTLVLKNGRTEQVHNYVLTKSYIFIGDSYGMTIPVDQIDIAATEQANRDAGVDFHVPQKLN